MAEREEKCGVCKKLLHPLKMGWCARYVRSGTTANVRIYWRILNQDKIRLFCGNFDKAAGMILKSLTELSLRQEKL